MGGISGGGWRFWSLLGFHHGAAFGGEKEEGIPDKLERQQRRAAVVPVLGSDVIELDLSENDVDLVGDRVELLAKVHIANEFRETCGYWQRWFAS
jgi:hypothetical protein